MFEGIQHNSSADGITCASYSADGVYGWVSFHVSENRSSVASKLGPDDAFRECAASHFYGRVVGKFMVRVTDEVSDYS
ncbi:hypothetical protein [Pseudomonas sp.]|uniref:hypothetical protein n=1 Tax=Pseudomonas sp. TaxID=306 RepID=UPI003CC63765